MAAKRASSRSAQAETNRTAMEAVRDTLREVGTAWSGCDGQPDVVDGLHVAACAFDDLGGRLSDLGDAFDGGRYRRIGGLFREAAAQVHVARSVDDPGLRVGGGEGAAPFVALAALFDGLARSADGVEGLEPEGDIEAVREALRPLGEVAAELRYVGSVLAEVRPEMPVAALLPHLDASLVWMGGRFVEVAAGLVIVAFFNPCADLCTPCGTAAAPYAFSGRYQMDVVQGGQRRVDPIFTTAACCSVSCLLIFSQCDTVTVDKVVAAPNNIALTNRRGVARAKVQIRNLIRQRRLGPPAFAAGDCP